MPRPPVLAHELFDYLRREGFEPYARLGESARDQLADGVRLIAMSAGDAFETRTAGQRVTVLAGALRDEGRGAQLTPELTRSRMVVSGEGVLRLTAVSDSVVLLAQLDFLDTLSSWEALAQNARQSGSAELLARLNLVKHSVAFRRLPMEHLESAIARMRPQAAAAGEVVVTAGDSGDAFYLIREGTAEVWRTGIYDTEPQCVATLGPGDTFGDEAVVTGGSRNATVKMVTEGSLLVLDAEDFRALLSQQLIDELAPSVVEPLLASGWKALDVRYDEEFEDSHIPGAIHIPLPDLRRDVASRLSAEDKYVTVCLSGKRSAVAALLLQQRGYKAVSMKEGMGGWTGPTESAY